MSLIKPVTPLVLPSDLIGVPNGSVPISLLTPCGVRSGYSPSDLYMHHLASRAMRAMLAKVSIDLPTHEIRGTSTLRSYNAQVVAFDGTNPASRTSTNGRYIPQELWATYLGAWTTDIKSWQGKLWKRRTGTAMAAVPGTSNHGYGLAIDFSEEYDGNPFTAEGITVEFTKWLISNAGPYGYSAESQSEDWHWRYVSGDNVPAAVLYYETHLPGPPHPPVYDEDMGTLWKDLRFANVFLVNGDAVTVGPGLYDNLVARGVPVVGEIHDQQLIACMRKSKLTMAQMVPTGVGGPFDPPADLQ